jgi:hypothetical protein
LVTEVTAVMNTIICSETLQLLTGPQLRAFSQTECQVSGLIGRGAL